MDYQPSETTQADSVTASRTTDAGDWIQQQALSSEHVLERKFSRRHFMLGTGAAGAGLAFAPLMGRAADTLAAKSGMGRAHLHKMRLDINGRPQQLLVDPRLTLLDALRDHLQLTGTKKGCDHGQCGACTVHMNGQRVDSCLVLAPAAHGARIETIEGLAKDGSLHPMQTAFIEHDGFQCGYCTSGQIMSAVGMLAEGHAHTDDEIREAMAGNLCRCGAYPGILAAIKSVREKQS